MNGGQTRWGGGAGGFVPSPTLKERKYGDVIIKFFIIDGFPIFLSNRIFTTHK